HVTGVQTCALPISPVSLAASQKQQLQDGGAMFKAGMFKAGMFKAGIFKTGICFALACLSATLQAATTHHRLVWDSDPARKAIIGFSPDGESIDPYVR